MSKNKNLFPTGTKRINLSVPLAMYDDIIYVSGRLGISSSSLFYQVTRDSIHHMASVLRKLPKDYTDEMAVKRLRGDSVSYIKDQYEQVLRDLEGADNASGK
jgi:hypothetical protein